MLTVESFGPGGAGSSVAKASRVLIRDALGNPLCLVIEYADGGRPVTLVADLDDPDFDVMLQASGVDRVTVLDRVRLPDPPPRGS